MYIFNFFFRREREVMDIVPLQYVNGLNQSSFFFNLSVVPYMFSVCLSSFTLFCRLQIKAHNGFYRQSLSDQRKCANSCFYSCCGHIAFVISWIHHFAKFISFVNVNAFFFPVSHFYFCHKWWWHVFKDSKICLALFVCCNMQWQYKEL